MPHRGTPPQSTLFAVDCVRSVDSPSIVVTCFPSLGTREHARANPLFSFPGARCTLRRRAIPQRFCSRQSASPQHHQQGSQWMTSTWTAFPFTKKLVIRCSPATIANGNLGFPWMVGRRTKVTFRGPAFRCDSNSAISMIWRFHVLGHRTATNVR